MAEFNFDNIETKGQSAMAFLISDAIGTEQRKSILKKNGIDELKQDDWYPLESIVKAFKDLGETIGEMNLFLVGKAIMDNAEFPPMDGLESALKSIDVAYHMNHRKDGQVMFDPGTGKKLDGIGSYSLAEFDPDKKEAAMICQTPYPSKFEEGLILQVVRRFKPEGSIKTRVVLDETKETRRKGGSSCTFRITW